MVGGWRFVPFLDNEALSPLGEKVARDSAFISRRGPGLSPPKGYGRSQRTTRLGPQAGEGVATHL